MSNWRWTVSVLDAPVPQLAESAFGARGRAELSGLGWSA